MRSAFDYRAEDIFYIILTTIVLLPFEINPILGSLLSWCIAAIIATGLYHMFEGDNDVTPEHIMVFSLTVSWIILAVAGLLITHNWLLLVLIPYGYLSGIMVDLILGLLFPKK